MVATLVFMIMVLGVVSAFSIPVDILPVSKTPAVEVLTYFQGMPASSIEKTITNRIERWVSQAPGAAVVESKSVPGVSVVKIFFRDDIDPNGALTLTNSLALGTLPTLPPNTLPPVVLPFDPTGTLPLGVLTVSNPELDEAHVKDVARIDVRNMLGAVAGAVAPVVVGGKDRTILIYLDPKRLQAKHLSPLDVVRALQEGNLMVTPGTAYFGENQVLLDTNALVKSVAELNDLPIRIEPGNNVYLRDIGYAEDSYAIQTSRVRINGKQQVYVPVYRQGGASSLTVAEGTKAHIPFMEKRLPEGTKLNFVMDQSIYVRQAIESLIHEGALGILMVAAMILVFLGNPRMTLIASLSIPLAVLGAIFGLYATGNTINAMTLGGLALAIGPLVDDAIVALENTHRHARLGKSRTRAALDGSLEVMVPVLVATCTTIIVLAPLALMPGMAGFLFRPLALAVAFAMLASFLLSRTFVPMMCAKFLPDEHRGRAASGAGRHDAHEGEHTPSGFARIHVHIERFLMGMTRSYERFLAFALRNRLAVLGVVLALFVGSMCLLPKIGREFFPQVDAGQVTIYVRCPSNLRLDASETRIAEVERFLEKEIPADEREMIVSELGLDPDWSAAYTPNSGQQDTVIRVQLNENRTRSAQEYAIQLRHALEAEPRFNDLRFNFDTGGMVSTALNFGVSSPIDIHIEGGSTEQAVKLAQEIRREARQVRGAADVRVAQRLDAPYLIIDVDRQKAANLGLSARDVIMQVVAAMNSSVSISRNFWIDPKSGNQYFVGVQYPEDPSAKMEMLGNVFATGTNQKDPVTLSTLVHIRSSTDAVEVNHVSLYRTFNVLVNTENRDIGGVASDIEARLKNLVVPSGMRVNLRGEYARMNDSFRRLSFGLAMAAILVYLLQVALFRSWVGPFIIMFTVPLGMIGVLTMLFVTHTTLNVQSEMGVIFLVGIAVNNGVLLLDFANRQRKFGANVREAITTAASIRFRPILMTFLATFLDLTPMAIGFGRGSEATVPLARAVVGGLVTSTFLTLVVVPILYTLFMKEGDVGKAEAELEAELGEGPAAAPPSAVASHSPQAPAFEEDDAPFYPSAMPSNSGSAFDWPEVSGLPAEPEQPEPDPPEDDPPRSS
jgi:multidrug efflux pump subunit AcrB